MAAQALAAGKEASDAQAQGKAQAAKGGYAWAAAGKVCRQAVLLYCSRIC